ncbi:MAG: hypothetical protein PUC59_00070 [Firmicutes bacterium]|nr:hypothetical protein [Bacillota bacterium]
MKKTLTDFQQAKAFWIFIFSLLSLGLLVISAFAASLLFREWHSLAAGIVLMILAIPFHVFGKRTSSLYLASFLINSVAAGFSVSAYYIMKNCPLDFGTMALALLIPAGILCFVFVCLQIYPKSKKITVVAAVVLIVLLSGLWVLFWVKTKRLFYSMSFFLFVLTLFYLGVFAVSVDHRERNVLRDISFGSFGSFIILTVIVSALLSEGDVLDLTPDIDIGSGKSSKRKNRHKGKHF